jgi:protein gp37
LSLRFGWSAKPWKPANAAENVILHPERMLLPTRWRQPRRAFVNSMSDLFHELVPDPYIRQVLEVMAQCPQHEFQVLSKRPERMRELHRLWTDRHGILPNVWLGTSIENDRWVGRADDLRAAPAAVRFISAEPLLGPLPTLDLTGIDWLIVGGESGVGHRPIKAEWVRDLRDRALDARVAFFFKQWGGRTPKAHGRVLDGRTWDQYPVRELGPAHAPRAQKTRLAASA